MALGLLPSLSMHLFESFLHYSILLLPLLLKANELEGYCIFDANTVLAVVRRGAWYNLRADLDGIRGPLNHWSSFSSEYGLRTLATDKDTPILLL